MHYRYDNLNILTSIIAGIACIWMGVGWVYPMEAMFLMIWGLSPYVAANCLKLVQGFGGSCPKQWILFLFLMWFIWKQNKTKNKNLLHKFTYMCKIFLIFAKRNSHNFNLSSFLKDVKYGMTVKYAMTYTSYTFSCFIWAKLCLDFFVRCFSPFFLSPCKTVRSPSSVCFSVSWFTSDNSCPSLSDKKNQCLEYANL